jgi:hypothetical protein
MVEPLAVPNFDLTPSPQLLIFESKIHHSMLVYTDFLKHTS